MQKKGQEVKYLQTNDIKLIRNFLLENNYIVFLAIFNIGLNTGLRISDYINLKFSDIENGIIRLKEKKTKKLKQVILNKTCLDSIELLKEHYKKTNKPCDGYLFQSYNTKFKYTFPGNNKAISYKGVVFYFDIIKKNLDIKYPIGTHSLRKTWGRTMYYKDRDVVFLMNIFNHSSPRITLRYIGIEQTNFDEAYLSTDI